MKINFSLIFCLLFTSIFQSDLYAQLPPLEVNSLLQKEIKVTRISLVPLDGMSQGEAYHYIISDSTTYTALFDSIYPNTDSTLLISLLVKDYKKVIYADSAFLTSDTSSRFSLRYVVDRKGAIDDIRIDTRIAKLEGYRKKDKVFRFDDLESTGLNNNLVLKTYRSGSSYNVIDEVKSKIFQELFWLHLFPSLENRNEDSYKSTQSVYIDLKLERVPSKLTWSKEGKIISVHQEVDQVEIYKGLVDEYELKQIEAAGPEDFFFRISSDATYDWNTKMNIPKRIEAELRTSVKGKEWVRKDQYVIELIPKK